LFCLTKPKKAFILSFILIGLLTSCKSSVEVVKDEPGRQLSLKIPSLEINKGEIVEWKLGKKRNKTISKGVRLALELPDLDTDLAKLIYKKGANAWIIKTVKHYNGGRDILDFGYAPFIIDESIINGKVASVKRSQHFVQVSYSGVRMPKKFEEKNCPIYGHKKIIDDFSLNKNWSDSSIVLMREIKRELGRHHKSSLRPQVLDAGTSLVGKYYFYIALMNSKTKTLMSKYIPYAEFLEITAEHDGELGEECLGFNPY